MKRRNCFGFCLLSIHILIYVLPCFLYFHIYGMVAFLKDMLSVIGGHVTQSVLSPLALGGLPKHT